MIYWYLIEFIKEKGLYLSLFGINSKFAFPPLPLKLPERWSERESKWGRWFFGESFFPPYFLNYFISVSLLYVRYPWPLNLTWFYLWFWSKRGGPFQISGGESRIFKGGRKPQLLFRVKGEKRRQMNTYFITGDTILPDLGWTEGSHVSRGKCCGPI